MEPNYYIEPTESKAEAETAATRLARIEHLIAPSVPRPLAAHKGTGRNLLSRAVDKVLALVRRYLPPFHWIAIALAAVVVFLYIRLVALTSRLSVMGESSWPDVPTPSVIALWHRDAPSLITVFAKRRLLVRTVIMIARDPRGDFLSLLCRMLGFAVVRGGTDGGWQALDELARELGKRACVVVTADGGGPARIAKVGAVALASAVGVPLIPLAADCHPGIEERHKWDAARNPVPFGLLTVMLGPARTFTPLADLSSIQQAQSWLQVSLDQVPATNRSRLSV